ncbi:right-handed parallel beta-helix repeat-containing protein [Streptomyces sp. SCSIO 30461]|uniref:right-handed parallel beta-helix repeat-containing protein n=1 Tax=Streptomyces sp. SCSIO 30461 TaxID=3118085 RepID=UPI00387E9E1C
MITGNVIQGNPVGVYFNASGATQPEVANNCTRLNNAGFGVQPAAGNGVYSDPGLDNALIHHNVFFGHQNGAIILDKYQNTLRVDVNNNVSHQDRAMVFIFRSNDSLVTDNTAVGTTVPAIVIGDDNHNLQVLRNDIQGSDGGVLTVTFLPQGSDQVQISDNTISDAAQDGIDVSPNSLTDSTISGNTVTNSGRDGILIEDKGGNLITGNVSQSSVQFDCEDLTTGSGTAGTANTWTANRAATSNPAGEGPQ